jgi:hypothetical protein
VHCICRLNFDRAYDFDFYSIKFKHPKMAVILIKHFHNLQSLIDRPGQVDDELLVVLPTPETEDERRRLGNVAVVVPLGLRNLFLLVVSLRPQVVPEEALQRLTADSLAV